MDIAVSIGNTRTKAVYISRSRIFEPRVFPTAGLAENPPRFLSRSRGRIFLASVVPEASRTVRKAAGRQIKALTWRDVPLKLKVKEPGKTGIDRLLNCFAAWKTYGCGCLVVDAGSALTIDFVSSAGVFEGGVIFPGIGLLGKSLKTLALLKKFKQAKTVPLLGRDTAAAVSSGILNGLSFLVRGYFEELQEKHPDLKPVFTGGDGALICSRFPAGVYNENLLFHGIRAVVFNL